MRGKIYLVGAGPGDVGLITVRGQQLLRRADVVVMDALVNPALVKGLRARVIYAGKRGSVAARHTQENVSQETINNLLIGLGRAGKRVVRLKGGDPFVFGRGSEEVSALAKAGIECEIVPGVSSAMAVPAAVGIPITDRRWASQVTFVTGHGQSGSRGPDPIAPKINWSRLPKEGTLVVLMGVASWKNIRKKLLAAGWSSRKPVAAVQSGTNEDERVIVTTLGGSAEDFVAQELKSPAVIVVGDVARLARQKKVVITRPADQSLELMRLLKKNCVQVLLAPTIRIQPLRKKFQSKKIYDAVLFLSANAVRTFSANRRHSRVGGNPGFKHVYAVGPQTKIVANEMGWRGVKMPTRFNTQGILASLGNVKGKHILIPRVQSAPKDLNAALRKRGAHVKEVVTYKTQLLKLLNAIRQDILSGVDAITFTSASTVRGFCQSFSAQERKTIFQTACAVSMGPQTSAALRAFGIKNIREAKNATLKDLVSCI